MEPQSGAGGNAGAAGPGGQPTSGGQPGLVWYPPAPPAGTGYPQAPASGTGYPAPPGYPPAPMGGYQPPQPGAAMRRYDWIGMAKLAGVIAPIVLGGLVILLVVGANIGPGPLAIGLATAVLPVPFLVGCFLWLDRYEPEPWKYLAFCFGWGACVATAVALGVNTAGSALFERLGFADQGVAVVVAPVIEESMKALGPFLLFLFRRKLFSGLVDGIVFCGLSAVGFAMAENILYIGGIYVLGSEQSGAIGGAMSVVALFVVRIGLTGFAHPLFTSMTGIALGIAARTPDRRVRWLAPVAGLIGAMVLHGTWNLMASLGGTVIAAGYVAVMAPVFFAAVGVALWVRSYEGRVVTRTLPPYVRTGWLSPPEVAALGTIGRRSAARRWAKRVAGDEGAKAMRAYQFAATRLALLRESLRRGTAEATFPAEERRLLDAIAANRGVFSGRDPQVPAARWDGSRYHLTFPDGSVHTLDPPPVPVMPIPVPLTMYSGPGYPGYR